MADTKSSYATPAWWKEAVVYQVYPSSFQSHPGNKSGWGSIKGITSRLDYIKSLGGNVLWSSPFLKSPQADMGYDISDYKDIDPRYGTLEDVDELLRELKNRDMHMLMDIVVNHTSNEHPWFLESKSSKTNPKRDWYIWKPAKRINDDGTPEPPNNWGQILGEAKSVWQWDEASQEFYLAIFTPEQPDLNWENPAVRTAVWDVMNFWLTRGASGFRLDVINHISKDQSYPDAEPILGPSHKYHPGRNFYVNGPRQHEFLQEMKREVLSKHEFSMTVGEMPDVHDPDEIMRCVSASEGSLNMVFIFGMADIDRDGVRFDLKPYGPRDIKQIQSGWQETMIKRNGWNALYLENHDQPRSVSRFGDDSDEWRDKSAQMLAMMHTTLGGTLFVYQGEELGIRNAPEDWPIENFRDVETHNYWAKLKAMYPNQPEKMEEGRHHIHCKARDHARTPMQWTAGTNAGFCDEGVVPWMPLVPDYDNVNADVQMKGYGKGELTTWEFWQRALKHRHEHKDVFVYGDFKELSPGDEGIYAYLRTNPAGDQWLVLLNMTGDTREWAMQPEVGAWVHSNYCHGVPEKPVSGTIKLQKWEGLLGKVKRG